MQVVKEEETEWVGMNHGQKIWAIVIIPIIFRLRKSFDIWPCGSAEWHSISEQGKARSFGTKISFSYIVPFFVSYLENFVPRQNGLLYMFEK